MLWNCTLVLQRKAHRNCQSLGSETQPCSCLLSEETYHSQRLNKHFHILLEMPVDTRINDTTR